MPEWFAIRCDSESQSLISSKIEREAWDSIQRLAEFLVQKEKSPAVRNSLFAWREQKAHLADARETYAWRGLIDSIKAADLSEAALQMQRNQKYTRASSLVTSKPIMLRIAGEITNALLHSYTYKHRITFFQCES
jgi:hypothetical protein